MNNSEQGKVDWEEIAKTIILSIDHYREAGRDDSFNIQSISDYLKRCFTPPPQPWVKASDKLSSHMEKVCCRKIGHIGMWVSGYYDYSRKVYMLTNMGPSGFKPEEIEYLDESTLPQPLGIDVEELAENNMIKDFKGSLEQYAIDNFKAGYAASNQSIEKDKEIDKLRRNLEYLEGHITQSSSAEEAIGVLDWLLEFESNEGGFPDKIIICDGDYYWESDKDGDQPLDGKDIIKIYKQSKK